MPLRNRNSVPPGGWVYKQTDADCRHLHTFRWMGSFSDISIEILKFRLNRKLERSTIGQVAVDLDDAQCERLQFDPAHCVARGLNGKLPTGARIVSLRRNGDIINLLPLLKILSDEWQRPVELVVHRDFIGLLDGVSYVTPISWDGDWEKPLEAASFYNAINAQVNGKGVLINFKSGNFAKDAWVKLGRNYLRHAPLIFDLRNEIREHNLAGEVFKTGKPKLLLKLAGQSSPMRDWKTLEETFVSEFSGRAEIVSLDTVKANRIYDLIGLMDRAHCLVTIDTSALWLAHASKCPMIQLVNATGFPASPPRGNCIKRLPYSDISRELPSVLELIEKALMVKAFNGSLVLAYNDFTPSDPEVLQRNSTAFGTWNLLGCRKHAFTPRRDLGRVENQRFGFVSELIESAFRSGTEDAVVIVNNDIIFLEGLKEEIESGLTRFGCWWSYRRTDLLRKEKTDNGADVFALTRSWWDLHRHQFPDFVWGNQCWDDVMVRLMMWSGALEGNRRYYHKPHSATDSTNRTQTPSNRYNHRLFQLWLTQHDEVFAKPTDEK